jgi:phosphoglycolate phosphatase-like HAD superfamily hydrolase
MPFIGNGDIKTGISGPELTRNSRLCTDETLRKHNLDFDYICTRDDLIAQKPNPEGLFKILNHFSLIPDNAIYIGDFVFDMMAAKNANMKSVYFGNNSEIAELATEHFNNYHLIYSQLSLFKI